MTSAPPVYFGNIRKAQWVKAPDSGLEASLVGAEDFFGYGGGGAFGSSSDVTHRQYKMSYSTAQIEEVQFLADYRQGLYGTGLLYWIDPYNSYWNALPPHWAAPFLTCDEWPSLVGATNIPAKVAATSALNNQPIFSATYTISGAANAIPDRQLVLLIPPTMQLSIGFSGSATNGGVVRVQPINLDGSNAATTDLTLLAAGSATRMNLTLSGATYKAVKVYLTSTTSGTATITLDSGDAIYSNLGTTPTLTGNHLQGRGFTGLKFSDSISMAYTFFDDGGAYPRRYVSAATSFTEIGAWL